MILVLVVLMWKKGTFYSFVCFENEYKLYIIIIIIKHSFDMPCY